MKYKKIEGTGRRDEKKIIIIVMAMKRTLLLFYYYIQRLMYVVARLNLAATNEGDKALKLVEEAIWDKEHQLSDYIKNEETGCSKRLKILAIDQSRNEYIIIERSNLNGSGLESVP